MYTIGVDTGGTFTDTVVTDGGGRRTIAKASTTPEEPERGVINSVRKAASENGHSLEELLSRTGAFYHGTTLVTNALVENEGSDVGMLTTQGFSDELHIGQTKTRTAGLSRREIQHYAALDKPAPMAEKPFIEEVPERIDYKGAVIVSLDESEAESAILELLDKGVEAIAVNLLWSFANPVHEQRLGEMIEELSDGDVFVSLSSDIAPRLGEYSRGASTLVNSYTGPLLSSYSESLVEQLEQRGLEAPIYLMQSNGGIIPLSEGRKLAVKAIGSGPAAGVAGAQYLGAHLGQNDIICTDVGGTSFDVGMVIDGKPKTVTQQVINQHTLHQTSVDIESIGSGAGSIAWVDDTGQLHVGPESAGADPGPACYDQGGDRPTVTDADLILGYLDPDYFLGGEMDLDDSRARDAMETHVAEPLGMSVEEAAAGVFRIVNSHMADLLHKVTIQRGYDPRRFNLYAYGGAGPMHASFYGPQTGIDTIIVPLSEVAPVYSAFGITSTDITRVEEVSDTVTEPFDYESINERFETLIDTVTSEMIGGSDAAPEDLEFERSADMRYVNQVNELEVAVPSEGLTAAEATELGSRFEDVYERRYGEGSTYGASQVEIVTYRVTARLETSNPAVETKATSNDEPLTTWKTRNAFWEATDGFTPTDIYDGNDLSPGDQIGGPAILQMPETTMTVRPEQSADVDQYGNVRIKQGG